jgi:hypothetical protein
MRRAVVAACLAIMCSVTQAAGQSPEIDDLKAPSTSAATLLGTSPTSIERPDNPKAVIVSLVSQVAKNGGVPNDYAFALTPYWMRWNPQLTFDSYARPTIGQRLVRTFNFSLASSDWTSGAGAAKLDLGSRIALGVSTVAFEGGMDDKVFTVKKELEGTLEELRKALAARVTAPMIVAMRARRKAASDRVAAATTPELVEEATRDFNTADQALKMLTGAADRAVTTLQAKRRMLAGQIRELDTQRYGPRLGIAAAWAWGVPDDSFDDANHDGHAVWVTPSYRWKLAKTNEEDEEEDQDVVVEEDDLGVEQPDTSAESSPASGLDPGVIELVGVARLLAERDAVTREMTDGWDVGARLIWQISGDLAVSGEFVKRLWNSDATEDTQRAVALVEARLGKSAYVFASFGRDFEKKGERTNLVSLVGIKIGVGAKPLLTN